MVTAEQKKKKTLMNTNANSAKLAVTVLFFASAGVEKKKTPVKSARKTQDWLRRRKQMRQGKRIIDETQAWAWLRKRNLDL